MLIFGRWAVSDDGIVRPVIVADVFTADGSWLSVEFLADVGADRTVFMASLLTSLGLPHLPVPSQLGGVGGAATTVAVNTELRLTLDGGGNFTFQGAFAGFTDPHAIDTNILGRDIMNLFAVIVDRPGDVVCMIGKGHRYTIAKEA